MLGSQVENLGASEPGQLTVALQPAKYWTLSASNLLLFALHPQICFLKLFGG